MKNLSLITILSMLISSAVVAQINDSKTEIVKVFGNCDLCKPAIERAGTKKKSYTTEWNTDTKLATITYNSKETNLDAVLKNIALSGFDNIRYLAPEKAYNNLPECCKYKRELKTKEISSITSKAENHNEDHAENVSVNSMDTTKPEASPLKMVFDNYFSIKDALVKSDGVMASAKAALLLKSINSIKMGSLKDDEHTVWMKVMNDLKSDAQHIEENKDPAHQREHFIDLSLSMYELVKVSKHPEVIYYQNCPMANDGKGANWLSKENSIRNPYYGSQMLTCGKTIEIIK